MFDVQHLVIKDVLDKPFRNIDGIQSLADRNAVVDVVVMTENALRASLRPRDRRLRNRAIEVTTIQLAKHSIKIVNLTLRRGDHLATPTTSREIR